jgi:non-specific serine/threonine protein kinase
VSIDAAPELRLRNSRRWWISATIALGGLVVIGAALLLTQGIAVRRVLGVEPVAVPCRQDSAVLRLPLGGSTAARWEAAGQLPQARDEVRAVTVGDRIVVGSGLSPARGVPGGFASLSELFAFDPVRRSFQAIAPLPLALDHVAFAARGNMLYAFGGWSNGVPSRRAFRMQDGRWHELPPMPIARAATAAAVVGDKVFVIGGTTARHDHGSLPGSGTVEVFDTTSGSWTTAPDMPTPRHHHAAVAVGKVIVVAGGRDGPLFSIAAVERLDTTTGRWSEAHPLPLAVGALSAAAVDGQVVVSGGGDDAGGWVTPATWALRADGSWRRLPDLAVARHGHGMAALNGSVYVFGGSPCAGYGRTSAVERLRVAGVTG